MGLRGDISTLRKFRASLKAFPLSLAHAVAAKSAPTLTGIARADYTGGRTVYGESRPAGVDGQALTLNRSGATLGKMRFEATGTTVGAKLGTPYARFLVGKYSILPMGALPVSWSRALLEIVKLEKPEGAQ